MGRFDRLPGIDEANSRRRNVLIGGGYALAGFFALGLVAPDDDESDGADGGGGGATTEPTQEPTAEPTVEPTAEPTPTATPVPRSDADELLNFQALTDVDPQYYDGGAATFDADSDAVTDTFSTSGTLTMIRFVHEGESNFIVETDPVDVSGVDEGRPIINQIGSLEGAIAWPARPGEWRLDVKADGPWDLTVAEPLPPAEEIRTVPVGARGTGPAVVGPVELAGSTVLSATHDGEENFIVRVFPDDATDRQDGVVAINEIGSYDGETIVDVPETIYWIDVDADGDWTLEFAK